MGVAMIRCVAVALSLTWTAGTAFGLSREAQEYIDIQAKMAPDQCALQKLSSQAAAAQRAGEQGKRQELMAQMEPIAKRIQAYQPRMQELAKSVGQTTSPDYQAIMQQTQAIHARCKP